MEQFVRDARITQIYEGANGIQALDLVGRKLPAGIGPPAAPLLPSRSMASSRRTRRTRSWPSWCCRFAKAFGRLQQATAWLAQAGLKDPTEGGAAATRLSAPVRPDGARLYVGPDGEGRARPPEDAEFARTKLATARFYMARVLPETGALFQSADERGQSPLMEMEAAAF